MPRRLTILPSLFVFYVCIGLPAALRSQSLPPFCAQVTPDQLQELPHPYAAHQTPDHSSYCEGMLTSTVGVQRADIISAKNVTADDFIFSRGTTATLSWCRVPGVDLPTHLSLRSINRTSYALDAQATDRFSWNSDTVALLHPDYKTIAALATSLATVQSKKYSVLLPVRQGTTASGNYAFIVHSPASNAQLVEAVVESLTGTVNQTLPIQLEAGPREFWTVRLSLKQLPSGVYRLYFRDDPKASGLATTPIYFGHGGCP
jgi:hypothetical protein